jgi:ATP-dependent DNA helicase DinG
VEGLVRDILAQSGPIARALGDGYEARPEQLQMADAVWRTMEDKAHLLVEAGTGVGKSFAYLVPAMLRCMLQGQTVVVATNTIALQEQLISKDIPLLQRVLEGAFAGKGELESPALRELAATTPLRELKAVLVKGRGNYVSIRRMNLALQRGDKLLADAGARRSLAVIAEWAKTTTDGTLSSLPQLERGGVWDKVQSDSGNCMGRRCRNYEECFYQRARREMESANLLVCNHALYFADLALRGQEVGFLPRYDHVILDEAHNIEDVAAEHFGASLSEGRVFHLLSTLYAGKSGKGYLPQLQLLLGEPEGVERAIALVLEADGAARAFFDDVARMARTPRVAEAGGGERRWTSRAAPARPGGFEAATRRIDAVDAIRNPLSPAMRELSLRLKALKDATKNEPDRFELNALAIRAEEIAQAADVLVSQSLPGCVYWAEVGSGEDSRFQRVTLACAPVEIAPLLRERLFSAEHSVVLTSATLSTRTVARDETTEASETAFAHTLERLGCEGARTLQLGSPFDYATQVEFFVDLLGPDSRKERGQGRVAAGDDDAFFSTPRPKTYSEALAERVLYHVDKTDGGAFVLFTSFAILGAVARVLRRDLEDRGMPLLAQGQDGSRTAMLEKFKEDPRSVLLGAASFWQGVDVKGRGLRNVIITKLPFDPPDRPLTEARLEKITARGGDPFAEDSLPRAVIKFKQGFGRLIRSREDHGRVVVLDPRIVTTRYGRVFLAALPDGVRVRRIEPEYE